MERKEKMKRKLSYTALGGWMDGWMRATDDGHDDDHGDRW
jgi:hypothetical protein